MSDSIARRTLAASTLAACVLAGCCALAGCGGGSAPAPHPVVTRAKASPPAHPGHRNPEQPAITRRRPGRG